MILKKFICLFNNPGQEKFLTPPLHTRARFTIIYLLKKYVQITFSLQFFVFIPFWIHPFLGRGEEDSSSSPCLPISAGILLESFKNLLRKGSVNWNTSSINRMALTDAIITTGTNQPWLADQYTVSTHQRKMKKNKFLLQLVLVTSR